MIAVRAMREVRSRRPRSPTATARRCSTHEGSGAEVDATPSSANSSSNWCASTWAMARDHGRRGPPQLDAGDRRRRRYAPWTQGQRTRSPGARVPRRRAPTTSASSPRAREPGGVKMRRLSALALALPPTVNSGAVVPPETRLVLALARAYPPRPSGPTRTRSPKRRVLVVPRPSTSRGPTRAHAAPRAPPRSRRALRELTPDERFIAG